jgi:hypothetical protein
MIDELAKEYLHDELRWTREALVWKLDGLSDYDIRRPLTATGTNLLGLVKHLATWEARYLGEIFNRPFPEPLPRWRDSGGSDLWVTEVESREQIIGFYRRATQLDTLESLHAGQPSLTGAGRGPRGAHWGHRHPPGNGGFARACATLVQDTRTRAR